MADTKTTKVETETSSKPNVSATSTPTKNTATSPMSLTERDKKIMNVTSIGSSIGFLGGLLYAFKGKKKFWGYVGYSILGSLIAGTATGIGARVIIKKDK